MAASSDRRMARVSRSTTRSGAELDGVGPRETMEPGVTVGHVGRLTRQRARVADGLGRSPAPGRLGDIVEQADQLVHVVGDLVVLESQHAAGRFHDAEQRGQGGVEAGERRALLDQLHQRGGGVEGLQAVAVGYAAVQHHDAVQGARLRGGAQPDVVRRELFLVGVVVGTTTIESGFGWGTRPRPA